MRLYALCDQALLEQKGISFEEFVAIARRYDAEIIQYRDKRLDIELVRSSLQLLRQLWNKTLLINDHILLATECNGVHIGQDDLISVNINPQAAIKIIRTFIGQDRILGLSTHNIDEIRVANALDLDYIGLGAYRGTSTKIDANILGENLDELASYSIHPVAAIGGVRFDDTFEHATFHVIGSGLLS